MNATSVGAGPAFKVGDLARWNGEDVFIWSIDSLLGYMVTIKVLRTGRKERVRVTELQIARAS